MATALFFKWDKAFSITSSYVRSRLAFAGVQAVSFSVLEGPASNGEVGWGLMIVLLWPQTWSKFLDYLFLFMITFVSIIYFCFDIYLFTVLFIMYSVNCFYYDNISAMSYYNYNCMMTWCHGDKIMLINLLLHV